MVRIEFHEFACFSVTQRHESDIRQFPFARIADSHCGEIMTAMCDTEHSARQCIQKITEQEHNGSTLLHAVEKLERSAKMCLAGDRSHIDQLPDQSEDVRFPFARR